MNKTDSYTKELLASVYDPENGLKSAIDCMTEDKCARMTVWLDSRMNLDIGTPVGTLDYSFESLTPLWQWFYGAARFQTISPKIIDGMRNTLKFCGKSVELSPVQTLLFTAETRMITFAIGHYVGKCFTDRSPLIKWGTYADPNKPTNIRPILKGFAVPEESEDFTKPFAPFDAVTSAAETLLRGEYTVNGLQDVCMKWAAYIPQEEI